MKTIKLLAFATLVILSSCNTTAPQSQEEIEYQKYATLRRNDAMKLKSPIERANEFKKAYDQSGLNEFITVNGGFNSKGNLTLNDLDAFYQEKILKKYENDVALEELRLKFVSYAVNAFGLIQSENSEETGYLIKYTRELMKNRYSQNPELIYSCLKSVRGKIDKLEFNDMLKNTKFSLRFANEALQETLETASGESPVEPFNQLRQAIENNHRLLSDFENIAIR